MKNIDDYFAPVLGELESLVLLALVRVGSGAYGAILRREIGERTAREISLSSMYVTLDRLTRKGMVVSYVGTPQRQRGGRRRKHYLLTESGQRALGRAVRTFKAMTDGIETALDAM